MSQAFVCVCVLILFFTTTVMLVGTNIRPILQMRKARHKEIQLGSGGARILTQAVWLHSSSSYDCALLPLK